MSQIICPPSFRDPYLYTELSSFPGVIDRSTSYAVPSTGAENMGAVGAIALHFARWGVCPPTFIYYYYSKLIINSKK